MKGRMNVCNSSKPNDAYVRKYAGPPIIHTTACRLLLLVELFQIPLKFNFK